MSAETITMIPARRTFFGLFAAAGKLGIIEEGDQALGLLLGGERVYFRNVVQLERGDWKHDMEYFPVHLTSDVGKRYTINLGSYFDGARVEEMFRHLQDNWQSSRG